MSDREQYKKWVEEAAHLADSLELTEFELSLCRFVHAAQRDPKLLEPRSAAETVTELPIEPQYEHECAYGSCVFLGRHTIGTESYDLYFCPPRQAVLARYGSEPGARLVAPYSEAHTLFSNSCLGAASRRAKAKGLV